MISGDLQIRPDGSRKRAAREEAERVPLEPVCEYEGFHPPSSAWFPDKVDTDTIEPAEFYTRYVATRTPCILTGSHISDHMQTLGNVDFLRATLGDQTVLVEHMDTNGMFGSGKKREPMLFGEFLERLPLENTLYMTTQYDLENKADVFNDCASNTTENEDSDSSVADSCENSDAKSESSSSSSSFFESMPHGTGFKISTSQKKQMDKITNTVDIQNQPPHENSITTREPPKMALSNGPTGNDETSRNNVVFSNHTSCVTNGSQEETLDSTQAGAEKSNDFEKDSGNDGKEACVARDEDHFDELLLRAIPPPLTGMLAHEAFPEMPPSFVPTMIPQMANLWIGAVKTATADAATADAATAATSSMLHLDYADNLYFLLRGIKKFELFSPRDIPKMRLYGEADLRVKKNGLACFDGDTRGDGAHILDVSHWRLEKLRRRFEAERADSGIMADQKTKTIEEIEQEELKQAVFMMGGYDDDNYKDFISQMEQEDEDHLNEDEGEFEGEKTDDDISGELGGQGTDAEIPGSDLQHPSKSEPSSDVSSDDCSEGVADSCCDSSEDDFKDRFCKRSRLEKNPLSFSSFQTAEKAVAENEKLGSAVTKVTVEIREGEGLYLPASWMHEVISRSTDQEGGAVSSDSSGIHIALNHWLHPPTTKDFTKPYPDEYWSQMWTNIKEKLQATRHA